MKALDSVRTFADRSRVFPMLRATDSLRPTINAGTILYLESVSVSFDGFRAVDELSLFIDAGELRCIIGPNGAGKTTMMDLITGKTPPDSGRALYGERIDLFALSEAEIVQAGIGRKFQKPTVFEQHTVFENLALAASGDKSVASLVRKRLSSTAQDHGMEVAETIGLADMTGRPARVLSHGQKQWLEIGMLLMQDPLLMLVDEPVAGMTRHEMDRTTELLTGLAGDRSVVVVEHDMDFVRSIARRVTVLHQGSVLAEGSMEQVQNDQRVIDVYLGA